MLVNKYLKNITLKMSASIATAAYLLCYHRGINLLQILLKALLILLMPCVEFSGQWLFPTEVILLSSSSGATLRPWGKNFSRKTGITCIWSKSLQCQCHAIIIFCKYLAYWKCWLHILKVLYGPGKWGKCWKRWVFWGMPQWSNTQRSNGNTDKKI